MFRRMFMVWDPNRNPNFNPNRKSGTAFFNINIFNTNNF